LKSAVIHRWWWATYKEDCDKMIKYLAKVQSFQRQFDQIVITQIPMTDNIRADSLARLG